MISQSVLSQRPVGENFKKFKIEGFVLDKQTQEYLEYATVSLINESFPNRIQGGITDTQGKFIFEVFPGKYNVTIEYIGIG